MADTEDVARVLFEWMFGVPYKDSGSNQGFIKFGGMYATWDEIKDDLEYLVCEGLIGIEKARWLLRERKEERC